MSATTARRSGFTVFGLLSLLVLARSLQLHFALQKDGDVQVQQAGGALPRAALGGAPPAFAQHENAPVFPPPPAATRLAPGAGAKRAVVSLMMPAIGKNESMFTNCLLFMIASLKATGWPHDVMVLATHDARSEDVERVRAFGVGITRVTRIAALRSTDPSMLSMFTKLHAWNLTQYDQIAYYDSDHVFLRDPSPAFDECGASSFCATGDTGASNFYRRPDITEASYFNAGFMLLRPNVTVMQFLLDHRHLGEGTDFVDQDMLNAVFAGTWKRLDERYNRMHTYTRGIPDDTVAVHEKYWELQKFYRLRLNFTAGRRPT